MNKRISKTVYIIMLFTFMYMLTACGFDSKNESNNNRIQNENNVNEINNQVPIEGHEGKVNFKDKNSYYFVINGQKYTTENTLKDIEASGFTQDSNAVQTDMQKGSYSLSGGFFKDSITGNTIFSVIPINTTDDVIKCADANIGGFYLEEYYYKDYTGKIEVNDGITIGSTVDELVSVFGDPTEMDMRENYENLGILYKYKVGMFQYFEFEIDKTTNKVKVISWRFFQNQ